MPYSTIIFSSDEIRGTLLSKAFRKNGFEVALYKNLHAAEKVLKTQTPSLVVLDKEGYFHNELGHFSSLSGVLMKTPVLVIANSTVDSSISLKNVPVEWCLSEPLDLLLIMSKANELLLDARKSDFSKRKPVAGKSSPSEKETLTKDLKGYLGLE